MCWQEIFAACFGFQQVQPPQSGHRQAIPPQVRVSVWNKYFSGSKVGVCYCCGARVRRNKGGWHCAHVVADVKGGLPTVSNLRVTCAHCNLSMGNQNLYAYIYQHGLKGPGAVQVKPHFRLHPKQRTDKRTNNWGRTGRVARTVSVEK